MLRRSLKRRNGKILAYIRCASGIMNGTREEDSPLAINHNCLPIVAHTTVYQLKHRQAYQTQQLDNWASSHSWFLPSLPLFSCEMKAEKEKRILGFGLVDLLLIKNRFHCHFGLHNFTGFRLWGWQSNTHTHTYKRNVYAAIHLQFTSVKSHHCVAVNY